MSDATKDPSLNRMLEKLRRTAEGLDVEYISFFLANSDHGGADCKIVTSVTSADNLRLALYGMMEGILRRTQDERMKCCAKHIAEEEALERDVQGARMLFLPKQGSA